MQQEEDDPSMGNIELDVRMLVSSQAKEAADLTGIKDDLEFLIAAIKELIQQEDDTSTVSAALTESALVRYRRCFTTGSRIKLVRKNVQDYAAPYIAVHDFAYTQANKHIAHAVNATEMVVTLAGYDRSVPDQPQLVMLSVQSLRGFENVENMVRLSELADLLLTNYINPSFEKLMEEVQAQAEKLKSSEIDRLKIPMLPVNLVQADLEKNRTSLI